MIFKIVIVLWLLLLSLFTVIGGQKVIAAINLHARVLDQLILDTRKTNKAEYDN